MKELERRLALGTAVAGEIVATTGTCTAATRGAAATNTPFVIGIATLGGSTIASAIAAIFPTTGTGGAITTTTAVAATTAAIATWSAAAVTATTTAVTATTAAIATWRAAARLSFIDTKRATHQLSALEAFDGSLFSCIVGHFDKSKSALTACIPFKGKGTIHDFTELGKQLSNVLLLSAEGKVANKNAHVLLGPGTKKWTEGAWIIAMGP